MRDPLRVIGIDPSLTGLAAYRSDGRCWERDSSPMGRSVRARMIRLDLLLQPLIRWARRWEPNVIVVEGYYAMLRQSNIRLIELGWQLRRDLAVANPNAAFYEVPPSSLKKIIAGKGNATKTDMAAALAVDYKMAFRTDNLMDAFGLMQIGRMLGGDAPAQKEHEKILNKIKELP